MINCKSLWVIQDSTRCRTVREAGGNTGGGAVVKGLDPRFMQHFLLHMEVEDLGTLMNTIIEVFTEVDVVLSLDGILMVQVQD